MSLLFNMLSRLVIVFLPKIKCLLISWLQSPSAVILEPKKIKSVTVSIVSPSICHEVMGPASMILVFWMLSFKPTFSLSSFTFIKRLFSSSSLWNDNLEMIHYFGNSSKWACSKTLAIINSLLFVTSFITLIYHLICLDFRILGLKKAGKLSTKLSLQVIET